MVRISRAMMSRLTALLMAVSGLAVLQVAVSPAADAGWATPPVQVGPRVCTFTRSYSDVFYSLCMDYQDQSHVAARPVFVVYASVTSNAQVYGHIKVGANTYAFSCPTIQVPGGKSYACYGAYRTITGTPLHNVDATVGIDGSWRPALRVHESRIKGSQQEKSNYCGPAAGQAALRIMGVERTQAQLASAMGTNLVGLTLPAGMYSGMNQQIPGWANQFMEYNYGISGTTYRLRKSIEMARPPTVLVRPGDLPGGNSAWYYRHWITVHGWAGQIDGTDTVTVDQFVFFDPGNGRRFVGLTPSQLNTAAYGAGLNPGDLTFVGGRA